MVKDVVEKLVTDGKVVRGYLGVVKADLDKETQKSATQVATVEQLQSGLSGLDLAAIQTQVTELQTGVAKISAGY
ncbi:hypothetical protein PO81_05650, partial [Vibrio parahaemolyticus]